MKRQNAKGQNTKKISNLVLLLIFIIIIISITSCFDKNNSNGNIPIKLDENATYIGNIKDDPGPFTITEYSPHEMMPIEMTDSAIWVAFSKPMVPLAKLGEPIKSSVMNIEPKPNGVFRWYGSRLLAFEPSEKLIPAKTYKVLIKKGIKSLSGVQLPADFTFTFHTEPINIVSYSPSGDNISPDRSKELSVTFNFPIEKDVVKRYLMVKVNKKKISFDISYPDPKNYKSYSADYIKRTVLLKLKDNLPLDSDVSIVLKKGAVPHENGYGTEKEITKTFHTLIPFYYRDYTTGSFYGDGYYDDYRYINLQFSQPVNPKDIEKYISVSLEGITNLKEHIYVDNPDEYSFDDYYYYGYGDSVRLLKLPIKFNTSFTVTIKHGLKDIYGQILQDDITLTMEVGNAPSMYSIRDSGDRILEASYKPQYYIVFQNITQGKYKIQTASDPFYKLPIEQLDNMDFSAYSKNIMHYKYYDLSKYLKNGKGAINMAWSLGEDYDKKWNVERLNLQVTNLGISVRCAYNKFDILVAHLNDGSPAANAKVNIKNKDGLITTGETDKNGFVSIDFTKFDWKRKFKNYANWEDKYVLIEVIEKDDKLQYKLNQYSHNIWHFNIDNTVSIENAKYAKNTAFVFSDRGLYRPGETVTYKTVDRTIKLGKISTWTGNTRIEVKKNYYDKNIIFKTFTDTTKSGTTSGSFKLPEDIEPGYYTIYYYRNEDDPKPLIGSTTIKVANFRRLNFSMSVSIPKLTYYIGDTLSGKMSAEYLAGGALTKGKYSNYWQKKSFYFNPTDSHYSSYRFGPDQYTNWTNLAYSNGDISGNGVIVSKIKTEKGSDGQGYLYELVGTIEDVDRQVVSGRVRVKVHPAEFYIGAKLGSGSDSDWWSPFVKKDKSFDLDIITLQADEKPYKEKTKITGKLIYTEWKMIRQKGIGGRIETKYQKNEITEKEFTINMSQKTKYTLSTKKCGSYHLILTSKDKKDRSVVTKLYFYSTGSDYIFWNGNGANDIELVTDKPKYKPGETANILMKSPLPKGKYMLTIEREGILEEKIIDMNGNSSALPIDIKEDYIPVIYVAVTSYSHRTADPPKEQGEPDLGKPKGYFGIVKLSVDVSSKSIDLKITKNKSVYRPGETVTVTIKATKNGNPVKDAEITYIAADRGVLDLINYHIANPITFFYNEYNFPLGVKGGDSRDLLISPVIYKYEDQPGGGGNSEKAKVRKDFRATAHFEPTLITDENGEVTFSYVLPDSLTTFRETAFAVTESKFGLKEDELRVSNPINVRTALPRMLRIGDKTTAGVVLTNLDSNPNTVEIMLELNNDLIKIEEDNTKTVTLKPNEVLEVPFELESMQSGVTKMRFHIKSDVLNEILEKKIKIEEPYVFETFTVVGKTKDEVTEGFVPPSDVKNKEGGLTLSLDSTRLGGLREAFSYLNNYIYTCLEQKTSKAFPMLLFGESVKEFGLPGGQDNVKRFVSSLLKSLPAYQKSIGGFSYWPEYSSHANIYLSIRVLHLITLAAQKGYKIPKDLNRQRLISFLNSKYYNQDKYYYMNDFSKSYYLYVLSLSKDNIKDRCNELYRNIKHLSLASRAFLALAYYNTNNTGRAKSIFNSLTNYIRIGTRSVDLTEPANTQENNFFFDKDSSLALLLMLYIKIQPHSQNIESIVNTLMDRQNDGYWVNTHATGWVLYAFGKLFERETGKKTNFELNVTLGGNSILETKFSGISKEPKIFTLNIDEIRKIKSDKLLPLTIKKTGVGTIFYSASLRYALDNKDIKARDEGISVYYVITDKNGDKYTDKLELGKNYRCTVHISSSRERNYMAVRVPIPSGAEPIDGSFVTSEKSSSYSYSSDSDNYYYWYSYYPIQKIYDNEVRFFMDRFRKGHMVLSFSFRTTTPGEYPTPPVTVELMYEPEVFGRSNSVTYTIQ